jgi:hypothetical protein
MKMSKRVGVEIINSCETHIYDINSLNAKLNPICHLVALLGAHHILHVSRIRINFAFIGYKKINKNLNNKNSIFVLVGVLSPVIFLLEHL